MEILVGVGLHACFFSLIIIWLLALSPKKLDIICTFVKIDDAEAWKISFQQSSSFFQKLIMTPLGTCGPINLTFSLFSIISTAVILQINEVNGMTNIAATNSTEVKSIRNSN